MSSKQAGSNESRSAVPWLYVAGLALLAVLVVGVLVQVFRALGARATLKQRLAATPTVPVAPTRTLSEAETYLA